MALIDKASLLMVPSTYEAGTLYNVLPSGNRAPDSTDQNSGYDQTRADFTFDRGSNAAATRVNADGLIEKYRENLLLQSNQFDTTWANSNTTETSGQSGYDGTNDAWLLTKSAANGFTRQFVDTSSSVSTFSLYAKANTSKWVYLNCVGVTAYYDLENGVVGTTSGGSNRIDTDITNVGEGWYRISLTGLGMTQERIYPAEGDTDTSGTSGSIYIQNAQLESGMVSTDVLTSGATRAKAGVLIDLPRINYDANGENGSLLLEPSRANLVQYSEYFNGSGWTKSSGVVITDNATISPEGVKNATLVEFNSSSKLIAFSTSLATGVSCSASCYIKGTAGETIKIAAGGVDSANIELTGDWQRVEHSATSINSSFNINTFGGVTARTIEVYGAQLEAGSYVSSYIPNHGTSGGVTRAADSCSVTGVSDVIGQSEGTLFAEFEILTTGEDMVIMNLYNETTPANSIYFYLNSSNVLLAYVDNSGTQASPSSGVLTKGVYKAAIAYKANDFAFYINGSLVGSDVSGSVPTCGAIRMENYNATPTYQEKTAIKQMALFQERLSNAELATLTTL